MRTGLIYLWLVLAFGLAPASPALAQGTIVYHQPPEPLTGLLGRELDLDNNGLAEVRFYDDSNSGAFFGIGASGVGTARLLVTPQGPNDFGSYLVAFNEGFLIGGATDPSLFWAADDAPIRYGQANVFGFYIPEGGDQVIPDGHFYGATAFMGIQFQIGEEWHNGWMRLRGTEWLNLGDAAILDWAYDTRPDMPILAGAVPEPSPWVLLAGGGVLMVWFRRKRNERRG